MTTILDDDLLLHAERVRGKVVLITGAANGIGKDTALLFARYGSKLVLADITEDGGASVAKMIREMLGGDALAVRCDVCKWDDQLRVFELAMETYGRIDIVIPIAGLSERGDVCAGFLDLLDGAPVAPDLSTLDVNLTGTLYTTHLALHYFKRSLSHSDDWKAVAFIGSMAGWEAIPLSPLYTCSKHAILGLMRSLSPLTDTYNVRFATIDPWFADTAIVPLAARVILTGQPMTPVSRISRAILCATADPDLSTSGCPWILPDDGPVCRLEKENLKAGAYDIVNTRIARARKAQIRMKSARIAVTSAIGKHRNVILVIAGGLVLACVGFGFRTSLQYPSV